MSAFDIAQIVQSTMKDRRRVKPKPKGSIIEALIEEALLEFTSLTNQDKGKGSGPETAEGANRPSTPGDPTNWEVEFSASGQRDSSLPAAGPTSLKAGNLSALEDDQGGQDAPGEAPVLEVGEMLPVGAEERLHLRDRTSAVPEEPVGPGLEPEPPPPEAPAVGDVTGAPSGMQGIVIAVVTAVVAFGLAWFTHLIPH